MVGGIVVLMESGSFYFPKLDIIFRQPSLIRFSGLNYPVGINVAQPMMEFAKK